MTGDDFERMLVESRPRTSPNATPPPRRLAIALVVGGALAGFGALAAALLLTVAPSSPVAPPASPPVDARTSAPASTSTPTPDASGLPSSTAARSIEFLADPAWVARTAVGSGIPERALAAYAGAALRMAEENPACALGWNTLAAIGHVESEHGTIAGSSLDGGGVARPAIVGIALDGRGVAAIPDTDGGERDGDLRWDRAVGPMQFIPSTWAVFAVDGNGDGTPDPQQIDDAALAAAAYLCSATGGPLSEPQHWIAAIASYNASVDYNNRVADAANFYSTVR